MSIRNQLIEELNTIADQPQNSFDEILSKNKQYLKALPTKSLSDLHTLRRRGERLCSLIRYSREEITLLTESGEVDSHKKVAELENIFSAAECIFSTLNGKTF